MQYTIIIIIDSDNNNLNYKTILYSVQSEIVKYFGTKNILGNILPKPFMHVLCEVTNEDLKEILKNVDNDSVNLLTIVIPDNCNCIKGNMIYLSEKI